MIYAYIRVSTEMQNFENQQFEITNWCNSHNLSIDRWISESVSGTTAIDKRELGKTIRKMKQGDMLICTEISRLGRNMLMIMSILNSCVNKGISIRTIKDNFDLKDNINSKIIAFAFALASEIERNLISQRTKEALMVKKLAGVRLGRPPGSSRKRTRVCGDIQKIRQLHAEGVTLAKIAKKYGIHRNTLSLYIRTTPQQDSEIVSQ